MNRSEHLLSCLAEECSEVAQRVSKALRFGLNETQPGQSFTNAQRIVEEPQDLLGVLFLLERDGVLPPHADCLESAIHFKVQELEKFMRYARERGTLRD